MSHPFSSTFDALQAHFTQKPDKPDQQNAPTTQPGSTTVPPTQAQASAPIDNTTTPVQNPISGMNLSRMPTATRPSPVAPSRLPPRQTNYRVLLPRPEIPPFQPQVSHGFQPPPGRGPSAMSQPLGHGINRGFENQTAPSGPPAIRPHMPMNATSAQGLGFPPNGAFTNASVPFPPQRVQEETPFPSQYPGNNTGNLQIDPTSQMEVAEDEVDPMDTATDALLERQNDLNQGNPMPKLPPMRGFARKWLKMGDTPKPSRGDRGSRASRKRGPRRAAEPTGDIKYRLNMASNAYMDGRLDEAIDYVTDAIRINAETYRAWILLASFCQEKGDQKGHYMARFFAAHLQPKVIDDWLQCAELAIGLREEYPEDADNLTDQAILCFGRALRVDGTHSAARHGRAALQLEMGRLKSALKDYTILVQHCLFDVFALRGLAEVCVLLADTGKAQFADKPATAIDAYRQCITHFKENGFDSRYLFDWQDVKIFIELLAYIDRVQEAVYELRSLSRWLLTRSDETFWDDQGDDREWDVENTRRLEVDNYQDGKYPVSSYGRGLPLEIRTKLAVYRLKLGQEDEAMRHMEFIDPEKADTPQLLSEHPDLVLEAAGALYEAGHLPMAQRFYEPLREPDLLDAESLVRVGRCYLYAGDKRQAEECFTAAIEQDESSNSDACIDARYELAKMYEAARAEREAYILVNEAIKLQEAREQAREEAENQGEDIGEDNDEDQEGDDDTTLPANPLEPGAGKDTGKKQTKRQLKPKAEKAKPKPKEPKERKPRAPKTPGVRRPKLFARKEELQLEEQRRAAELAEAWQIVRESRASSDPEAKGPSDAFMVAARKLVDDFRSYKDFYGWDKFLAHLGIHQAREKIEARKGSANLIAMAQRLSHNLNPEGSGAEKPEKQVKQVAVSYRGVPFDEWLDLFLEYAIGLAQTGKFQDAYKICESARDATVFKSKEDMFLIHVTWAACALRGRDEETCVATARWIMREYQYDTDPFRMFSALSRLCPSPASWYASGPVQKYMLRQIKLMDRAITAGAAEDSGEEDAAPTGRVYQGKELDITLLMVYGHILFISNSFTFALNYFMRAYSLDPTNSMVILSVGHCYLHYALKRQAENRQYLLAQGFHFLHQYYEQKLASPDAAQRQEAHYNLARSYHAVGIPHIAAEYYKRALQDVPDDSGNGIMGRNDLTQEAAYNLGQICWTGGDVDAVKAITEKYLVL
ncbi:TPR-like protein [Hypoxylon sp. FL1857]|nr:TPR-like protein [Hypoxylon sp. FL1857]